MVAKRVKEWTRKWARLTPINFCNRQNVLLQPILFLSVLTTVGFCLTWIPIVAALTLEDVEKALHKRLDVKWQPLDSGVHLHQGTNETSSRFGLHQKAWEVLRVSKPHPQIAQNLPGTPTAHDWRNHGGHQWLSSVKNQRKCGSCVEFAAIAALEGQLNIATGTPGMDINLSEQYLLSQAGSCNSGSLVIDAMNTLKSHGIPDESCFPYTSGRLGEDQPSSLSCLDAADRLIQIHDYTLLDPSAIKRALLHGPLVTTITLYEDFLFYGNGIYEHIIGDEISGHAVTLVGYNDNDQAWIFKNHWGEEWGEEGYFRVKYTDDSSIGGGVYRLDVRDPNVWIKLISPEYLGAVSGNTTLKAQLLGKHKLAKASFVLSAMNKGKKHQTLEGNFNLSSLTATDIDSSSLADGTYQVQLTAEDTEGRKAHPWYSTLYIVNTQQKITLALQADFTTEQPISGLVHFLLNVDYESVPLSEAQILFKKLDGSVDKTVVIRNPGSSSKIGWRTMMVPDGDYEIYATGMISTLAKFHSTSLRVTVKN